MDCCRVKTNLEKKVNNYYVNFLTNILQLINIKVKDLILKC